MTEEIKDGGQAFPQPIAVSPMGDYCPAYPGMTLRDYFAAKVMQGMLVHQDQNASFGGDLVDAKVAYRMADAMLAAREAK